jgi:hypothetical protein
MVINMDKRAYLINRFKKDFLRYNLLQEDSISAAAIAEKLYGVIEINDIAVVGKQQIESICNDLLSFEKVNTEELRYDLKDQVVSVYKDWLNGYSVDEIVADQLCKLERNVELQAWSNGISNMSESIKLLVERLSSAARSYNGVMSSTVSEKEVLEKFAEAKEITLVERVTGNNIEDVVEYRSLLLQYVKEVCANLLYAKVEEIYSTLAANSVFERLQSNFSSLTEYASELKASIEDTPADNEWDKEYNRNVPTDFYARNVENITAERAFQMVLLQFFAKNEEWMVENGLLVDGDLKVYTNSKQSSMENLVNNIFSTTISY